MASGARKTFLLCMVLSAYALCQLKLAAAADGANFSTAAASPGHANFGGAAASSPGHANSTEAEEVDIGQWIHSLCPKRCKTCVREVADSCFNVRTLFSGPTATAKCFVGGLFDKQCFHVGHWITSVCTVKCKTCVFDAAWSCFGGDSWSDGPIPCFVDRIYSDRCLRN